MVYLRTKRISGHKYVYLVESVRIDGKISQRSIASLGRLDAEGKPCLQIPYLIGVPQSIGTPVEFGLEIEGEPRLFKGVVTATTFRAMTVRYPFRGAIAEVQLQYLRLRPLTVTLPLAGKGRQRSRRQGVLF